jgi:hypothetical protein
VNRQKDKTGDRSEDAHSEVISHARVYSCRCKYTSQVTLELVIFRVDQVIMATEAPCYTVVFEDTTESPSTQELRASLEKGSDEDRLDALRRIIVSTINGNPQVYSLEHSCNYCDANAMMLL